MLLYTATMPTSDRAFRALARAEPETVVAVIRTLLPDLLPDHAALTPEDLSTTHLDALPATTACFAPAADSEGLSSAALCRRTAEVMRQGPATWYQRHMAVVAAAMDGRYEEMVKAMEEAELEPVIIEDLVKFGMDRGREEGRLEGRQEGRLEGREEGRLEGRAEAVLAVLRSRGLTVSEAERARIRGVTEPGRIDRWLARVANVASTAALFDEDA